ncbi:hypothetical protein [Thiohalobacter thiocyanaticus]|uniref:Uncharacterized protein n=1 Tax=Thiohalobacter thiocyanaticus TaxID=585455 RepID=A0A426QJK2_9GAMM|nr:hypothetical protein [Thiohalobacter thiocyanaticus]RRQ21928.1 hypothetical protein D6C00_08180 [Thiohalobacter thiocyanaticus]
MQMHDLEALLETCPPAASLRLADWYALPLPEPAARALLAQARQRRQSALKRGEAVLVQRLIELIAGWWCGQDLDMHHASLSAECRERHEQALLELVTGQLLISRRLAAARPHLQQGFALAAPLLPAQDYFTVMKRHGLLEYLPLGPSASAPLTLDELLTEAAVIRRLQGGRPGGGRADPADTLG